MLLATPKDITAYLSFIQDSYDDYARKIMQMLIDGAGVGVGVGFVPPPPRIMINDGVPIILPFNSDVKLWNRIIEIQPSVEEVAHKLAYYLSTGGKGTGRKEKKFPIPPRFKIINGQLAKVPYYKYNKLMNRAYEIWNSMLRDSDAKTSELKIYVRDVGEYDYCTFQITFAHTEEQALINVNNGCKGRKGNFYNIANYGSVKENGYIELFTGPGGFLRC